MQQTLLSHIRYSVRLKFLTGAALVAIADFLFYQQDVGWTVGGFAALMLAVLLIFSPEALRSGHGRIAILLTAGQCLALVNHPGFLSFLLVSAGLVSIALLGRGYVFNDAAAWGRRVARFTLTMPVRLPADAGRLVRAAQRKNEAGAWLRRVRRWTLPVVLTFIFLCLLAGGNPVIGRIFNLVPWATILDMVTWSRIFFWCIAATIFWPFIRPKAKPPRPRQPASNSEFGDMIHWLFTKDSILRSLILFNLLFAVQTVMDIVYLWGGMTLPDGMTPAEYAHHGAYPLVATALLAAVFVLIALRPGSESGASRLIRRLVYGWVAQNVLLVISSIWRTALYVEEYSLTWLRLSALIWMALVAGGLTLIVLRIALGKSNVWLINMNALMLAVTLYVCSGVDLAGIIATYNVEHSYEVTGKGAHVDYDYLRSLGPPSLPALKWLQVHQAHWSDDPESAENCLLEDLLSSTQDWRSWTLQNKLILDRVQ